MKIVIELRNRAANVSLTGISVQVSYFIKTESGASIPKTEILVPDEDEELSQNFSTDLDQTKDVFFVVFLNGINILAQAAIPAKNLKLFNPLIIEFDYTPVNFDTPEPVVEPKNPLFLYGRLLEKNGKRKLEEIQIIIEAKRPDELNLQPIASVITEANGYFFIEYPKGPFMEAVAYVGLKVKENPVPIRLQERALDIEGVELVFPKNIIIVVELVESEIEEEKDSCGCEEIDMYQGKRVLEEYSFYSLVRTTEPEIQGFVLEEEDDLTLEDVLNDHPIRIWEIVDPVLKLPAFAHLATIGRFPISDAINRGVAAAAPENNEVSEALKKIKINKNLLNTFLKKETALTKENIVRFIDLNEAIRFRKKIAPSSPKPLGRVVLNATNRIVWDFEPMLYQAVSVAHGHLLHFKSEWIADGYSLGDLLYSLPLAPGQKKQIVVFDWERRESASNVQSVDYEESLYNSLSRDRDIFEISKGVIQESIKGKSSATTASASAGIGGVVGGLLFGVSGGVGHSGSNASQDSLRQTSASDLQKVRDRLVQSANAVRSQRSTVIQTVAQGERFEVSSETIANYNHCHAITIQYFEVLRHFKVRQRFAGARECLLVPLLMSQFDLDKTLRWKEALQNSLLDNTLIKGFDAAQRIKNEWTDSNFPSGTFASGKILNASGNFQIQFIIRRPEDKLIQTDDHAKPIYGPAGMVVGYQKKNVEDLNEDNWQSLIPFMGADTPRGFYDMHLKNARNKDEVFHRLLGEKIALAFVDKLTFHVADETGNEIASMNFDSSLTSRYRKEGILNISVRFMGPSTFGRDKIHYIKIRCGAANALPAFSSITVQSGFIRYKTPHFEGFLCKFQAIHDDLSPSDGVILYAGPSSDELRDPRKDDLHIVNKLIDHLNDNLEYFHKAIWMQMSDERRFMLLDGILLPGEKGLGRSLASLVENELIGIVGNSLVFPVAQGLNLDPNFGLADSLTDYYMVSAADPVSISIPTKGVYAEAMMGKCNSCEEKDESRFWRWEESPIPDSPTTINPINTDSRRAEPGNLQPASLPAPMLNIQNAPNIPDPTGLAGTLSLLGKGDAFRDITGLAQNQTNALEALKASFEATKMFGQEAAKLEMQKMMEKRLDNALKSINNNPNLDKKQKADLTEKALNAYLGAGAQTNQPAKNENEDKLQDGINKNIDKVNKSKSGEVAISKPDGTKVNTKFNTGEDVTDTIETRLGKGGITPLKQDNSNSCWASVATMMLRWKDSIQYSIEQVLTKAGQNFLDLYTQQQPLPVNLKDAFISSLGMTGEPLSHYTGDNYREWLISFGPLWVTTDSDATKGFSAHARIITGISNDLQTLELIDPAQGKKVVQSFEEFMRSFKEVITDSPLELQTQVVHFTDTLASSGEGADPSPDDIAKSLNEYDPADVNAIIINQAEFTTGITAITNYKDWKTNNAVPHNKSKNPYRSPNGIIHLVLHETAADTGDGFDDSDNETSHLSVKRDATILQFNDLAEWEHHCIGLNKTSIGVEFVNRGWLSSSTSNGGEGIPAKESELTAGQKETYKEANGYLWAFWGYGFNIYRVPPSLDQLEKEVELVHWLTQGLQEVVASANSIDIENMFPSIDQTWLQLVSYSEVKGVWNFADEDIPSEDVQDEKNLFVMTTGYNYLVPTKIKNTTGIISHNACYDGHSDGSFLALYTWLRLDKSKTKDKAFDLCKKLIKNHYIRVSLKGNTSKKIFLVNVEDSLLV